MAHDGKERRGQDSPEAGRGANVPTRCSQLLPCRQVTRGCQIFQFVNSPGNLIFFFDVKTPDF